MQKPTVHLVKGLHITAMDKRNILAAIDFLEEKFAAFIEASPQTVPNYGCIHCTRKGSPKSYAITPRKVEAGTYDVEIRTKEKNDYGVDQSRVSNVIVRVKNRAPLYRPDYAQPDNSPCLFSIEDLAQ